ncbi:MAG: peptide chain release factor 1 [Candidatus Aenigmarchaeota archaeon]|nr:peptide chain release factor 1 [Candidatus Aenigmarchaeota archaeon]
MEDKITEIKKEYQDLNKKLSDPKLISNLPLYQITLKRQTELKEMIKKIEGVERIEKNLKQAKEVLKKETDSELLAVAQEEVGQLEKDKEKLDQELKSLLLPSDPNDKKNVIMEIRAGAGGDEAALFAAELFRMYSRFAEKRGFKIDILSSNPTSIGGFKEIIFGIEGNNVYKELKFESGVHRVQRVPETESSGRIHTSTVTVAVLPEAEEVDLEIKPEDLRIDVFRSQGAGGQSVNTTDSAVRVTHLPSKMTVACQDERSQIKNRVKALSILRSRLLSQKEEEERKNRGEARRIQIGTGDRSEKIRTYNFPQDRVTDHRINLSLHNLPSILDGGIDHLIQKLTLANQEKIS